MTPDALPMMRPAPRALVRRPPRSYARFYADRGITIDLALADRQHAAYVAALEAAGLAIAHVAPDEQFPDGVFIEDTGIVWNGRMLVTRMIGWREGEQAGTIGALERDHEIVRLPPGATIEGGDVMHTDSATFVGLTTRTNVAGVAALREFLAPAGRHVVPVPVPGALHLKSVMTWLGDNTVLVAGNHLDVSPFARMRVLRTPPAESKAANTLRIGTHVLMLAGHEGTESVLREFAAPRGVTVTALDVSEFEKGDGSLTCLSIIL